MTKVHRHNPYTGKEWDVIFPDPEWGLNPNSIILIEDGKERIVHKRVDNMMRRYIPPTEEDKKLYEECFYEDLYA